MNSNKKILIWVSAAIVFASVAGLWAYAGSRPGKLDEFAQCLKEKNAVFYGAFWCPHCQNQKKMFGKSVRLLPYVECSTPDGRGQKEICKEKNIDGYPTWEFSDGSRLNGEISLEKLREKTGCALPSGE